MLDTTEGAELALSLVPFDQPVVSNTPDDQIFANVRANAGRGLPFVNETAAHDRHAVLVGGGPSLTEMEWQIRAFANAGYVVFALNGAAKWLSERGIRVDFQAILDPRAENAKFVEGLWAAEYLIASQCHADVLDALKGRAVTLFHPILSGIEQHYVGDAVQIGGGVTVGFTAMALVHCLGYRKLHLFGYDSSDREGEGHAYPQSENAVESRRNEVWCGGRKFHAQPAFAVQAQLFPKLAGCLTEAGCEIAVYGDGLLQTVAREMAREPEPNSACYDLSDAPASYDFIVWLVNAEMDRLRRGVPERLKVSFLPGPKDGFRDDNLPVDTEGRQRFLDNVVRPALALLGATEQPPVVPGYAYKYLMRPISDAARRGEAVPALVPPQEATAQVDVWLAGQKPPVVVTLREAGHWPHRNSDLAEWLRVARWLTDRGEQVIFFRDTEKAEEPIGDFEFETCPLASTDLLFRAALYARAKCNLFVSAGPAVLAYFGDRPYLTFKPLVEGYGPGSAEWWAEQIGVPEGEQFPWARPYQRLIWADDTFDNVTAAWIALQPLLGERN